MRDVMNRPRRKLIGFAKDIVLSTLNPVAIPLPMLATKPGIIRYRNVNGTWEIEQVSNGELNEATTR